MRGAWHRAPAASVGGSAHPAGGSPTGAAECATSTGGAVALTVRESCTPHAPVRRVGSRPGRLAGGAALPATRTGAGPAASAPRGCGSTDGPARRLHRGHLSHVWPRLSDAPAGAGGVLLGRLRRRGPSARHAIARADTTSPRGALQLLSGPHARGAAAPTAIPVCAGRGVAAVSVKSCNAATLVAFGVVRRGTSRGRVRCLLTRPRSRREGTL